MKHTVQERSSTRSTLHLSAGHLRSGGSPIAFQHPHRQRNAPDRPDDGTRAAEGGRDHRGWGGEIMIDHELAELVRRIGNLYTKRGLIPPFALRDAAREWRGLSQHEIMAVIELHFDA